MGRAKDLFLKAVDIRDKRKRDEFLTAECEDDQALKRKVLALVKAHEEPVSYLDKPAVVRPMAVTEAIDADGIAALEGPGSTIGHYRLLQEIGQGGFGVVFMAEQSEPVRRQVALKIIKPGMDTREVIARFEAERQALALMDHPNIARVLDAGATVSGRPYFVMELVRGVPLTEFCDKNSVSTEQRLELFVVICRAVQHAHQKGIIHRDLKPSNVMVTLHDGKPVPKVIDFGISKAISQKLTEKTLFTRYGQMVGTPQYMSPEQAEMSGLDIDTRSDIYSLGVILYELLTGTTPLHIEELREAGYAEMLRLIQETEAPKPSTRLSTLHEKLTIVCKQRSTTERGLSQMLRGDLDWIVMKALDKDRSRRYESATALAEDVRRHLADEPVTAGAPTSLYLLQKLAKRNRGLFAATGAIVASLVLGLGMATYGFITASRDRETAKSAAAEAEQQRELAEHERQNAMVARDEALRNEQVARLSRSQAEEAKTDLQQRLYDDAIQRASLLHRDDTLATHEALDSCPPELRHWEWHRLKAQVPAMRTILLSETGYSTCDFDPTSDPENPRFVMVEPDGRLTLKEQLSGKTIWENQSDVPQMAIAGFSPDGQWISIVTLFKTAMDGSDAAIEIWTRSGQRVWQSDDPKQIYYMPVFSPDGKYFVVSEFSYLKGFRGNVALRSVNDFSLVWEQDSPAFNMANFSLDSKRLLYTAVVNKELSKPSTLRCLNVANGDIEWVREHPAGCRPAIHPDGHHVVLSGQNHDITLYDMADGSFVRKVPGYMPDDAPLVHFSRDGKRMFTMGSFGHVAFWDVGKLRIFENYQRDERFFHVPRFKIDGSGYFLPALDGRSAVETDFESAPLDVQMRGHNAAVLRLAMSDDGLLLSGDSRGTVVAWEPESGAAVQHWPKFDKAKLMAFSSPANTMAAGTSSVIRIWQDGSRRELPVGDSAGRLRSLKFSPDGTLLAAAYSRKLLMWSTRDWSEIRTPKFDDYIDGFCFLDAGSSAIVLAHAQVELLNIANCSTETLRTSDPLSSASVVCFLPQSKQIALGVEQRIEVWDVKDKEHLLTCGNDTSFVTCLEPTSDGKRLFVGNAEGEIVVWSLTTGRRLFHWQAHSGSSDGQGVTDLLLSSNQSCLYSSGADGIVRAWESHVPSAEVTGRRNTVQLAYAALDRMRNQHSSVALIDRLRGNKSLEPEVLACAIQQVSALGGPDRLSLPLNVQSDIAGRIGLDRVWIESARRQDQRRANLSDRLAIALSQRVGSPLDEVDPTRLKVNDYLARSHDSAHLPIPYASLNGILELLTNSYPRSPVVFQLQASVCAANNFWRSARQMLVKAIALTDPETELAVALHCQLGAIAVHDDDDELFEQCIAFVRKNLSNRLSPGTMVRCLRFLLTDEKPMDSLTVYSEVVADLPAEALTDEERPWLEIVRGQLAAAEGKNREALEHFQEAIALCDASDGANVNYARSTAYYLKFAAVEALDRKDALTEEELAHRKHGYWGSSFILQHQPFVDPAYQYKHRNWELWIFSVLANQRTERARSRYGKQHDRLKSNSG